MSKVKAGGSTRNGRNTAGKRLGIKIAGGQKAKAGQIIVRQVGQTKRAGSGTYISRNFSIHAAKSGTVRFRQRRFKLFSGKLAPRVEVIVE